MYVFIKCKFKLKKLYVNKVTNSRANTFAAGRKEHRIMALAVSRLLHHCHSWFAGFLTVQEFWRCCFLFPLQDLSVLSAPNQWHPMRWRFTSSCVWASPASPTTVRHAPLLFLCILLLNNWSLIPITISSTTLLLFCVSLYQFILSFFISFLSVIPFRGWKESVNCGWPINLGRPLSLFLFCCGKPRLLLYMTFVIHFSTLCFVFFLLHHSHLQFQVICRLSNYISLWIFI